MAVQEIITAYLLLSSMSTLYRYWFASGNRLPYIDFDKPDVFEYVILRIHQIHGKSIVHGYLESKALLSAREIAAIMGDPSLKSKPSYWTRSMAKHFMVGLAIDFNNNVYHFGDPELFDGRLCNCYEEFRDELLEFRAEPA